MSELPHPVHGVEHGLGHKLGPFPVGVWLLIVAGGLAIAWWARGHAATPAAPNATDTSTDTTGTPAEVSAGYDASGGAGQDGGSTGTTTGTTGTPGVTTAPHTRVVRHHPVATVPSGYTVKRGDTLASIAAHMHRLYPRSYPHLTAERLYARNATLLNVTARRHGKRNSDHGRWIYPGERLHLR